MVITQPSKKRGNFFKYFLLYGLMFTIYSKTLFSSNVGGIAIDFFSYSLMAGVFLFSLPKFFNNKYLLLFFITGFLISIGNIFYFSFPINSFLKNFIRVLIFASSTYFILTTYKHSFREIIEIYINVSFYIALFGVTQFIVFKLTGISLRMYHAPRITSILAEPSHLAVGIIPAVFMTLLQFKKYKFKSIILLWALLGTVSATALFSTFGMYALTKINWKGLFLIPVFGFLLYTVATTNTSINNRIKDTIAVFSGKNYYRRGTNLTVLSLKSNLDVAVEAVNKNPLFGCGIGNHPNLYYRTFDHTIFADHPNYGMGSQGAHSLTIRVLSEMGLVGLFIFLITLFRSYIRKKKGLFYHAVSVGCLSHFMAKTFKMPSFEDYGTLIFLFFLLFNMADYLKQKRIRKLKNRALKNYYS